MTKMSPARPSFLRALRLGIPAALAIASGVIAFAPVAHAQQPPPPPSAGQGAPPADPAQDTGDPAAADPNQGYADDDPSALADFREPLEPYGQWIQDPTYGTVWVPDATQVGPDFAPYQTAGQWGVTDDGGEWMWQSDYAWGYIPFHYGRWVWAGTSWGWVPGRRYAPAWVSWRVGENGYVGWAPTPPTFRWGPRGAVALGTVPLAAFCFVPVNLAFARGVGAYVVRDRAAIPGIAAGTHPFHSVGANVVGGNTPSGGRMSPTLSQAHVPSSASPARPSAHDARAVAYASRSGTRAAQAGNGVGYGNGVSSYRIHGNGEAVYTSSPRVTRYASPGLRTPGANMVRTRSAAPRAYPSGPRFAAPASAYHPPQQSAPAAHPSRSFSRSGRRR
jgi:hypothetical protein